MSNKGYTLFVLPLLFVTVCIQAQSTPGSVKQKVHTLTDTSAKQDNKQLDEVVVTGQYAPRSIKNSVYKIRVINQEAIQLRGVTNVLNVLSNELGVRLSTDYTLGETDLQLMGVSGQRVKVLLDGVPLVDRDATRQSLAQIDISQVERIEIIDGPMSTAYGTDALGGVINLVTKKSKAKEQLTVTSRVQEESVGKYYDPFTKEGIHNENIGINWQHKGWGIAAYGTRNNFGGYKDTAAYPAKVSKPKEQWITGATLSYNRNKWNIWYRLDYLDEKLIAAGVMNINTGKGQDQYYITHRYTHQLQANWQLKHNITVNNTASYQDYTRNTETYTVDYLNNTKTVATGSGYWDVTKFKTLFFRSTMQWFVSPIVSLQPGIEIKNDQTSGQRIQADAPAITDYSLFVSAEITPVNGISIRPGIRFSKNSQYDAPPVIPSLNAKFGLTKNVDLRLSYAHGFRAPILRELYFYFFDANHSIEGNPALKAEYSDSYMASVAWSNNKPVVQLTSTLSGFYNNYTNFIDMALIDGTSIYSYFNVSKYKTAGTTLENKLNYRRLIATLGFSYIGRYNQLKESDASLPQFTWSPEVNSNIIYRFTKLKGEIGVFYKFTGQTPSYSTSGAGDIYLSKISSWHWADITISKHLFKYFTVQGGIKNLFNVQKVNSTLQSSGAHSTGGPILTGYGRSWFMGLSYQWSKH